MPSSGITSPGNVFIGSLGSEKARPRISIATAASLSDRSLIVQQQPEVINLAGFFGALQEAPLAYEAYLGAQKLEGLLPWTQVVEKLQTHHELAYALGVTWEDLQLALRADIKRTWEKANKQPCAMLASQSLGPSAFQAARPPFSQ